MLNNIKIGHVTDNENETGATVILFENMTPCSYYLAGSAPATRDISVLEPTAFVPGVHALCLSGGSAFGLAAADGVMQWLKEHARGLPTAHGVVPIVPAASIYDFSANSNDSPTREMGYQACQNAKIQNFTSGRIGAGTAATVGKLMPQYQASLGGLGIATYQNTQGLEVMVLAVVNAVGDIVNTQGKVIAGAMDESGEFVNLHKAILNGEKIQTDIQTNTTLISIMTNATFDKPALARIAKMASTGMARSIMPCFSLFDGDIIFAAATGICHADETTVSVIAAQMTQQAIYNAVSS